MAHVPPIVTHNSSPLVNVCINVQWASFIDGALSPLLNRDAWTGTDEQIDFAIEQIQRILGGLSIGGTCE